MFGALLYIDASKLVIILSISWYTLMTFIFIIKTYRDRKSCYGYTNYGNTQMAKTNNRIFISSVLPLIISFIYSFFLDDAPIIVVIFLILLLLVMAPIFKLQANRMISYSEARIMGLYRLIPLIIAYVIILMLAKRFDLAFVNWTL